MGSWPHEAGQTSSERVAGANATFEDVLPDRQQTSNSEGFHSMISILKWLFFAVEIVVLGTFFLISFFAPVISGVSKIPTIAALAAGSFVPALTSAVFLHVRSTVGADLGRCCSASDARMWPGDRP